MNQKKHVFICLGCRTKIWCEEPNLNASCEDCGERFLDPEELKEELLSGGGHDD
jgi:DNA-directed RNA polymerase subunit RPC12/RpoP